jgi:hypothetical protein
VVADVMAAAGKLSEAAIAAAGADAGVSLAAAGVAMGRVPIPAELDRILGAHALLHAAEGELYRDALVQGADARSLRVVRFLNREVRSEGAGAMGFALPELEEQLARIGKATGRPWTKDEKDATAAAMLALHTVSSR